MGTDHGGPRPRAQLRSAASCRTRSLFSRARPASVFPAAHEFFHPRRRLAERRGRGHADAFDDASIAQALRDARLPRLADRLDEEAAWDRRLSPGEQQRLAFARALLNAPRWLFLDEATAALDEATGTALYALLLERLPGSAVVSIAHDDSVAAFHRRRVHLTPGEAGSTLDERAIDAR